MRDPLEEFDKLNARVQSEACALVYCDSFDSVQKFSFAPIRIITRYLITALSVTQIISQAY